jgi:hypothetical protein
MKIPPGREPNMYAAIRRYDIDAQMVGELTRRVTEGFVPRISNSPGFVAYYVVDEGNGVVVSISVFEDQTGAEESGRRAAQWVRENLSALLPNPPRISAGAVVVHTMGDRKLTIAR